MQSQTIPKETSIIMIFWGMIRGMIRGYDSHKSNFLPLLKTAPVKKRHSHIYMYVCMYVCMYICIYVYIYIILSKEV